MALPPHVVILGGGFGGLNAARTLARANVRVTLIDRHNYHLFQPLLYQVATAALSPGDVASPIRWILRRQSNVSVLLGAVQSVDVAAKTVLIDTNHPDAAAAASGAAQFEAISYDYLIVATGAAHAYFGHAEWAPHAPGLKTLDDALDIRRRVLIAFEAAERETDPEARRRLLTFVIVGGGPTGVELAGALAEIARESLRRDFRHIRPESARIVLVEGGADVLGTFPQHLRDAAARSLQRLGVEVRTRSVVTRVDDHGVSIGPERIDAVTVLWAAGVTASPVARSLGAPLDRAGRVLAEPTLQVPGVPHVFVVGDICALQQDGQWLPGVAQVAKQGGTHAAKNILRMLRGDATTPFHYLDFGNMATIGRGSAVADIGPLKVHGLFAWFIWVVIHIFWLIGFRNRVAVMSEWAWAFVTLQRRVRLITGEPALPRGDTPPASA
ncbi:MAG: NAD(P)/FAD-dependent oxidoreductase [Vicinamibacterales bacterium]